MAIKLLENAGIENTGIGASALNNLITGNKSGIVGKYLNECAFTATGNTIIIDKGLLIICGRQVEIDAIERVTLSSLPSEDVRYQIVIELIREESGEVTASIFARQPSTLIQENLLKDGFRYQFEIGRVTHKTTGQVTEALRTADILTAGGGGGADFEIGDVTTEMLAEGIPAEVDIEKRTEDDKTFLDFTFAIPKGDKSDGEDIKDTVTTFTEATTRANIETGEKTSTVFGKVKKWFADLGALAFKASIAYSEVTGTPTLGTVASKNTGTTSGTIPVLDSNGKLATSIVPDVAVDVIRYNTTQSLTTTQQAKARSNMGAGTSNFSGSYTDLTSKPTLGTVASKNTGTAVGDIPLIGAGGKIGRYLVPNADGGLLGTVAGLPFANATTKVGATYAQIIIGDAGDAYAYYPKVDTAMSDSSINLVQNKVVKAYVDTAESSAKAYVDGIVGDIETLLAGV